MNIDEIKTLLKSGDIAGAETAAQELLTAEPDNVQAMLLYGTCRQLQGDEATFRRIHDELAPKMESVMDDNALLLWRRYRALKAALIISGLALTGVAVSGCAHCDEIRDDERECSAVSNARHECNPVYISPGDHTGIRTIYAAPEYYSSHEKHTGFWSWLNWFSF